MPYPKVFRKLATPSGPRRTNVPRAVRRSSARRTSTTPRLTVADRRAERFLGSPASRAASTRQGDSLDFSTSGGSTRHLPVRAGTRRLKVTKSALCRSTPSPDVSRGALVVWLICSTSRLSASGVSRTRFSRFFRQRGRYRSQSFVTRKSPSGGSGAKAMMPRSRSASGRAL